MKSRPRKKTRGAPAPPAHARSRSPWGQAMLWLIVLATVALVVSARLRLADVPLERDEGEYAYAGRLILDGVPPYAQAYNMKFPGTYYAYAGIMAVFGETPRGIRLGLLLVNLAAAALLFSFARRLAGTLAAAVATAAFLLLSLDRWTMGGFAHATHFVLLPWLGALVLLERGAESGKSWQLVTAGVLAAVAVSMKQHAVFLAVLAVAAAFLGAPAAARWRRAGLVTGGGVLGAVALTAVLGLSGVLGRFWFWTFQYAAEYVTQTPPSEAIDVLAIIWPIVTTASRWFWYVAAAGLMLMFIGRASGVASRARWTVLGWLLASVLTILPGFYFREHYFIVLLPVVALLVGVAVASLDRALAPRAGAGAARVAGLAGFLLLAGTYLQAEWNYYARMTNAEVVRAIYGTNPFLESPEIGRYIREHSTPEDRIVVLGSEPQIPFYADRRSATGYIYMYGLMERHQFAARMQDEMIREVEAARPRFLVFVATSTSWLARPDSERRIFTWANEYTAKCYDRVGVADVLPDPIVTTRWGADSLSYQPRSASTVLTFRRRDGCQ